MSDHLFPTIKKIENQELKLTTKKIGWKNSVLDGVFYTVANPTVISDNNYNIMIPFILMTSPF
jgi:hypothetical protein